MRRGKKGIYPTVHRSAKIPDGEGVCRSPMEKTIFCQLDADMSVKWYLPEPFEIPYSYKGRMRNYIPDIRVHYADSSIEIIEVKPIYEVDHPRNIAKFEAAGSFCDKRGYKFRIQVVRGVSRMSSRIHTIQKKYDQWQDAAKDWKALLDKRDRLSRDREMMALAIRGLLGWGLIIYVGVQIFRSCTSLS